jgi:hypothetical protein
MPASPAVARANAWCVSTNVTACGMLKACRFALHATAVDNTRPPLHVDQAVLCALRYGHHHRRGVEHARGSHGWRDRQSLARAVPLKYGSRNGWDIAGHYSGSYKAATPPPNPRLFLRIYGIFTRLLQHLYDFPPGTCHSPCTPEGSNAGRCRRQGLSLFPACAPACCLEVGGDGRKKNREKTEKKRGEIGYLL